MRKIIVAVSLLLLSCSNSFAGFIDFSSDTFGYKTNGFNSVSETGVKFYDSMGSDLYLGAYYESNGSNALVTFGDDISKLQMVFSQNANMLKLEFGNDDPYWDVSTAVLDLYLGSTLVGQSFVAVNHNDLMDQAISFSGAAFDNAFFYYQSASGAPAVLTEVVDNISFSNDAAPVPEPSTVALLAAGLAGIGFLRRRQKEA